MRINGTCAQSVALALLLTASSGPLSFGQAAEDLQHTMLMATDEGGMPPGAAPEQWLAATGEAEVVAQEDGEAVIEIRATNLVPEGLYTFW